MPFGMRLLNDFDRNLSTVVFRITGAVAGYTVIPCLITAIVSKAYHALDLFLIKNKGRKIIVTSLLL
jgi:hypothetical protein